MESSNLESDIDVCEMLHVHHLWLYPPQHMSDQHAYSALSTSKPLKGREKSGQF